VPLTPGVVGELILAGLFAEPLLFGCAIVDGPPLTEGWFEPRMVAVPVAPGVELSVAPVVPFTPVPAPFGT